MNIAIAQIKSVKGNIPANIQKHIAFINQASLLKASSIFFPELSLTGYEPELAKDLAVNLNDNRLDVFQEISDLKKITIGVGIPTLSHEGILISMLIFQPEQPRFLYSKQQLHEDEFPYFVNGKDQVLVNIEDEKIAPAICYESLQINHADKAVELGAQIYIASVAKSKNGIDKAYAYYAEVSKNYKIPVLMSNCIGECDNLVSAGCSAVWNKEGKLMAQFDNQEEGIIIFNTQTEKVTRQII
ncbi:carbon-nitrogen hydrolase family protein [Flavobacterium sp. ACN6]|uniref:carbon-nitrogen hydrolase family protein n=1 Tax=Flavobacterium sp. ACN6 TaxID=1920426 RepID=UPI000BB3C96B|nr:carbon-nitrogen hydrolase family protein [Flavobacterium sp. ACN6]PBJ14470.1 Carbon-nitrogen hydrolase [Flavobacterium sp. ACN6]